MLVNKLYLLLIVIVVILLCKNTIEGLKGYKYDGLNYSQCASIPGRILCELSDEACIKDDFSGFKNEGDQCSVDGYSGTCITIQVDEGGSNVDKKLCNVTNDEINRLYQSELNSNPPIDTYSGNNYYTIKAVNGDGSLKAHTHAPACSEDSSIASRCASLMEGEYVNCSNNRDCCLCNQSKWNKIYTSKNSDTINNGNDNDNTPPKSFDNIDLFNNVPSGEKIGYNIVKLDDTNKGNFTDKVDNDNFKRYFILPGLPPGITDKHYTPSKGYFFNQYNDNYQTEHVFDINEYPGYIKSGPCGDTDQPSCPYLAPGSTSIMSDFFYEECLNEKEGDQCSCDITSVPDTHSSQLRNPNCIRCPTGENKQGDQCVPCSETNKVIDSDGVCVTCDSLDKCNGRFKCIYTENEQGIGECYQIDLHENHQVIRSDCVPKDPEDHADTCKIDRYGNLPAPVVGNTDYLYYLSNDTSSNTLDDFYNACLSENCEVVQSIIDSTEGYINYNSVSVTTPVGTRVINNDYNLITNEYCKSIDDENKCEQITQCSWKTDKCLLNIHDTGETNLLTDNIYYIPLRNSDGDILNNVLRTSSCNQTTADSCVSETNCSWTEGECYESCNIPDSRLVDDRYFNESELSPGTRFTTNYFNSNIKCNNLSDHINDTQYIGDPKGICFDDELDKTMYPIGCIESKEFNDLILHKNNNYINTVVINSYLRDLRDLRALPNEGGCIDVNGDCFDVNGDCIINTEELLYLLAAFGRTVEDNPAISVIDINDDGIINTEDLLSLLAQFGTDCSDDTQEVLAPTDNDNIGVTTNHNIVFDHITSNNCHEEDIINCNVDPSKSSKLIDTCRELCENNTDICNEYGVKFPTSLDYSETGCYLSKYCTTALADRVPEETCIDQPCNGVNTPYEGCIPQPCTDLNTPYEGCIEQDCTGTNGSGELLPYPECVRQECTDVSTPHPGCLCTQGYINEHGGGMCFPQECTALDTPHENCLCSSTYHGERCVPQECTDIDTPHPGCLCTQGYINQYGDGMCFPQECTALDTPHVNCLCSATYNQGTCVPQECNGRVDGDPYPGCSIPTITYHLHDGGNLCQYSADGVQVVNMDDETQCKDLCDTNEWGGLTYSSYREVLDPLDCHAYYFAPAGDRLATRSRGHCYVWNNTPSTGTASYLVPCYEKI